MQVTTGILCDFASIREGLLFVVGGGVTRLRRPTFPAVIGCDVALVLELHPMELTRPHEIELLIQGEDGERVASIMGGFQAGGDPEPGENLLVPVVFDLRNAAVPKPGWYSIEVSVDGNHQRTLRFRALMSE